MPKQESQTEHRGLSRATIHRQSSKPFIIATPQTSPKGNQSRNHTLGLAKDTARRGHKGRLSCGQRPAARRALRKGRFLVWRFPWGVVGGRGCLGPDYSSLFPISISPQLAPTPTPLVCTLRSVPVRLPATLQLAPSSYPTTLQLVSQFVRTPSSYNQLQRCSQPSCASARTQIVPSSYPASRQFVHPGTLHPPMV